MTLRKLGLVLGLVLAPLAAAQAFDVTSVKIRPPGQFTNLEFGCEAGRFASRGQALRQTIQWAFDIKPFQLKNLPAWATAANARYDIEGRSASTVTLEQCRLMAQQLLADRFQLKTHREDQNARVVVLTLGKDGPKMSRPIEGSEESGVKLTINGSPVQNAPGAPRDLKPPIGWPMGQLADILEIAFIADGGLAVLDRTGLEGLFRIALDFGVTFPGQSRDQAFDFPDVFTAVQKLGLKLEERTEPFPMLVIDRLERPDEN